MHAFAGPKAIRVHVIWMGRNTPAEAGSRLLVWLSVLPLTTFLDRGQLATTVFKADGAAGSFEDERPGWRHGGAQAPLGDMVLPAHRRAGSSIVEP